MDFCTVVMGETTNTVYETFVGTVDGKDDLGYGMGVVCGTRSQVSLWFTKTKMTH